MTRPSAARTWVAAVVMAGCVGVPALGHAQTPAGPTAAATAPPFVVEYYYKVRWGHFAEFLRLYKKNHYPLMLKEKELGRILAIGAVRPRYHGTEDGRWDFRVTITWRDAATANDGFDPAPLVAELYPDRATFEREEQHRFELLEAHWDLPVEAAALDE